MCWPKGQGCSRRKATHFPVFHPFPHVRCRKIFLLCNSGAGGDILQYGCMERLKRKRGPEVWQFRWSVSSPDGKRLYHKKIVGTVERYPDENAARRSVVGL